MGQRTPNKTKPAAWLRELNQAIARNDAKPLVPWAKAKRQLELA
jgi:hypothetical protein